MKNRILILGVIGAVAGMFLASCGETSNQKIEAASQDFKDARADYVAEWQKFKTASEEQIKSNEERIEAFKAKIQEAGSNADTNATYNKAVEDLEQKNRDLKRALNEYKDEGESRWQEFKTNFTHDMDAVGKTMKDLFKDNG